MIIVKGERVIFKMRDGSRVKPPATYGIIHDPEGKAFPRCAVFVGPVRRTAQPVEGDRKVKAYFGGKYTTKKAIIEKMGKTWKPIGEVTEILYVRKGKYAGAYYHVFKSFSPTLSKSGRFYRLELRDGCLLDDRGFIFP